MEQELRDKQAVDFVFTEKAQKDILAFTLFIKEDYMINWHHRAICRKLNAFARGEIKYLMISMPPRHGKSQLVSKHLPAYLHGLYPDCEIMAVSYLDSLASDMTVDIQKIIDSPEYHQIFPDTQIYPWGTRYTQGVRNSTEHHIVGRKGKYRGQGVGGSFTGRGSNFIIIDDPIKGREIADSQTFRERLWSFYNNDLFSRLETDLKTGRQGQVLITQTRWHEDDLSGRLLELAAKEESNIQWDVLSFPAIKTDIDNSDPRQIGEALWPDKYDLNHLNEIKMTIGPRAWSSLYQQSPTIDGGSLFTETMFRYAQMPGKFDWCFVTADTSYKEKQENDFTAFSSWGVIRDQLYLRDVFLKQIKASDIEKAIEPWLRYQMGYGYRYTYIEPKGHGIYLNQIFSRKSLHIPSESQLKEFYSDRRFDKVERANNVVPQLAYRFIEINQLISIKEDLVNQCLGFPKVKHDDFVDTLIDALKIVYNKKISTVEAMCGVR